MKDLNELVVRNELGRISVGATLVALERELNSEERAEYDHECRVESAVNDVFYKHFGVTLPVEAFAAEVAQSLNVTPANYATAIKQIKAYVKLRPSQFTISKGKGGGIFKNSDRSEDQSE